MRRCFLLVVAVCATAATHAFATVTVSAPRNASTVGSPVHYVASATSTCAKGVAAIGIYTAPNVRVFVTDSNKLDTSLQLNPGTYHTVVQEWDNCGQSSSTPVTITVAKPSSGASAVNVIAPTSNSVNSPVHYTATATTTCSKGVAAMGIYTADNQLAYTVPGASLDTSLSLNPGSYNTTVQSWDHCGGSAKSKVALNVTGGTSPGGYTFSNVQAGGGWNGYALLPTINYNICTTCKPTGPHAIWSTQQGISSPSVSGKAMKFNIGGDMPFADILWNVKFTRLLKDQKTVPNYHNFTYDVWFFGQNLETSQALEFDINQFFGGMSFIWGHECRIAGGHEWDTWNNVTMHWVKSGIPCNPISNAWNHLVIQVARTGGNHLVFKSITLNGVTHTLNRMDSPTPTTWYGITLNYQMDGNSKQQPYSVYLDKLNFSFN
jgi:hypothetical protein